MEYESDDYNENETEGTKTEMKEDPKKEMKEILKHYMTKKQLSNLEVCFILFVFFAFLLCLYNIIV